jgi:hypothetical protein
MELLYGAADRIWVMDRGMVSDKNLGLLRQNGRRYIIGTPKACLKQVEQHLLGTDWQVVREGVSVKICPSPDATDEVFILCKSRDRASKEQSMHDRFIRRIDEGLEKLQKTCEQANGKNITNMIERRVGRLLAKNSRGTTFYTIKVHHDTDMKKTIWNEIK